MEAEIETGRSVDGPPLYEVQGSRGVEAKLPSPDTASNGKEVLAPGMSKGREISGDISATGVQLAAGKWGVSAHLL